MPPLAALQVVGPSILFAALLAAEIAGYALRFLPTSQALWSLNLGLFDMFQKSYYILSDYCNIPYFQLVCIGTPLVLTAYYGLICNQRFALSLASSLSFLYVVFLSYTWYAQSWRSASVDIAELSGRSDIWLIGFLGGASLLSLAISHMNYLRACKAERNGAKFI